LTDVVVVCQNIDVGVANIKVINNKLDISAALIKVAMTNCKIVIADL
jgi:hypothetical protein